MKLALCALALLAAASAVAQDSGTAWAALAKGGHVALIRHANAPGTGDPQGFSIEDCKTQRNLDDLGRAQAKALGDAFRNRKINVSRVVSSPWCRCVDTARLMAVGNVETSMSLLPDRDPANPVRRAELKEMISVWRGPGTLVLLTHGFTIRALFGFIPASAETIVVKPRQAASAGGDLVGRIATPQAQPSSLFIEDLTWPEVRDAIANGKTTAIYYAGSTEQNGPHMALGKHNFIARYVAGRIAEALGNALAYPILPFAPTGDAAGKTGHMRFPGSVTVSNTTYGAVAREVALSAISAGFRNVVLMGDHGGGQDALKRVAVELDREWSAKGAHVYYVGDLYFKSQQQAREYLSKRGKTMGTHAGISDSSEVMYLDKEGKWIRRDKLAAGEKDSGVDGDPRDASSELGKAILDFKVQAAVEQIRSLTSAKR
ncbi:MAG TPA: creatininase family protein [Burkholderiales bacterium]|nr:creatininase family protein [Burkholderiales bacterium]